MTNITIVLIIVLTTTKNSETGQNKKKNVPYMYLWKVLLCEFVCNPKQFSARVCVGKGADAEAVGAVELPL